MSVPPSRSLLDRVLSWLANFAQQNWTVFGHSLACCQCHHDGNTSIISCHRNRLVVEDGVDECRHFADKALIIAFKEKMEGKITMNTVTIADHNRVGIVIIDV